MKFIDGVQSPGTIKTGIHIGAGCAYLTMGNYVVLATPSHAHDMRGIIDEIESAAAPLRRPSGGTTRIIHSPRR